MSRTLVLGASGFLGGAIAARLLERGDALRVLVRSDADAGAWDARGIEVCRGDLGDPDSIAEAADGCRWVINAAGIVSPAAHPRALRWTHVAGTENLLNACQHVGVERLVHFSCADATLANVDRVHWDEARTSGGKPFGARARSLQLGEELAVTTSALEVVALRPAWLWGPGDTSRLPGLLREGLSGGIRLVGDGRTYFATTYVVHAVDAALAALRVRDAAGRVFHIADALFQHTRDFFQALSAALGLPAPRSGLPFAIAWPLARLRGEAAAAELLQRGRSTLLDFGAAIGALDYDPHISMEDGLAALAAWVEERGGVEAVAALEREPPGADAVDAQVRAAGGD